MQGTSSMPCISLCLQPTHQGQASDTWRMRHFTVPVVSNCQDDDFFLLLFVSRLDLSLFMLLFCDSSGVSCFLRNLTTNHRRIHNKLDHLPSLVVEAGLEQVRPFCCWYTPPTFHTHFNRILCAVNMFIGVLFKEKYHLYTNNAQD